MRPVRKVVYYSNPAAPGLTPSGFEECVLDIVGEENGLCDLAREGHLEPCVTGCRLTKEPGQGVAVLLPAPAATAPAAAEGTVPPSSRRSITPAATAPAAPAKTKAPGAATARESTTAALDLN